MGHATCEGGEYETCDTRVNATRGGLTNVEQMHRLFVEAEDYGSAGVDGSTDDSEELVAATVRFLPLHPKSKVLVTIDVRSLETLSSFRVKLAWL